MKPSETRGGSTGTGRATMLDGSNVVRQEAHRKGRPLQIMEPSYRYITAQCGISSIIPCSFDKLKTAEGPIQSCSTSGNPFCAFLCSAETCFLHMFSSGHAVPHRHCLWLTVPSFVAAAIKAPSNAGGKDWLQLFLQLS